jgi:hypothetical protein
LGSESETCVGSRVRLVGVFISSEKNFYQLPFTPPLSGSPYRSFTPLLGCRSKTPTAGASGRGTCRRSHGKPDGFNLHQATVSFNCGDTIVFGSWVCTADGAGSFQRRLTMTPNPKTRLVTLPEVITGNLTGKFSEISLYNQHANFEFGSASNSISTSPWTIACEPATQPSCADSPLHEHFPYGLFNASKA